jgi:hypothetical protein
MRQREWFKRWRNDDRSGETHEKEGGRRGSGSLSLINRLWKRKPGRQQGRGGTEGSSGQYAHPLSHGLF